MITVPIVISETEYHDYTDLDQGICLACGEVQGFCEPDAKQYTCEVCDEAQVIAFEQALIEGLVTFDTTE